MQQKALRTALAKFTTGVTIVTAADESGNKAGITVNSFSSVSLQPPLVLWSIAKTSRSFATFFSAQYFVIHVLTQQQKELARRFATSGIDKFAGLDYRLNEHGVPVLAECCAHFYCRKYAAHEAGDHWILLGEVMEFDHTVNDSPLVFHQGELLQLKAAKN